MIITIYFNNLLIHYIYCQKLSKCLPFYLPFWLKPVEFLTKIVHHAKTRTWFSMSKYGFQKLFLEKIKVLNLKSSLITNHWYVYKYMMYFLCYTYLSWITNDYFIIFEIAYSFFYVVHKKSRLISVINFSV